MADRPKRNSVFVPTMVLTGALLVAGWAIFPSARLATSNWFYRAQIGLLETRAGMWLYGNPQAALHDRDVAYDALARSGLVLKLAYAYDHPLPAQQRLAVLNAPLSRLNLHIKTGTVTRVVIYVDDANAVPKWIRYLDALQ